MSDNCVICAFVFCGCCRDENVGENFGKKIWGPDILGAMDYVYHH